MKKLYTLLLAVLLISVLPACKKDPAPILPKKELILRAWKIKRVLINGAEDKSTNYGAVRLEFKSSGTYTYTTASGTASGTWELAGNDQVLITNKGTATEEKPAVLLLTADNLNLQYTFKNYKNGDVEHVYEFIPAPA